MHWHPSLTATHSFNSPFNFLLFSGGRLITVRGMYFGSAETITVKFSYRKWNAKLKVCYFLIYISLIN